MIHHVGLEVRPAELSACTAFWELLGWHEVLPAEGIGDRGCWLANGTQQIHLLLTEEPDAPRANHVALVDPELDVTVELLGGLGYEILERTPYWGARRVFTRSPAGHRVELMSAPPA